jgi:ABC-type antimicrobial peptide transport system, ATPase component
MLIYIADLVIDRRISDPQPRRCIILSMINVKNITKIYGDKKNKFVALKDVNIKIQTGASVAIVGKSGSGKSTLMHIMSGLDTPQKGEVIVDGGNIFELSQNKIDEFRASEMGFVFQSFFVQGNETCYENVSLPLETAGVKPSLRKAKITKALKSVELLDKMNEKAKDLSGGQKQRLAIARAIVNKPTILFADEPTGNLDSATGEAVIKTLFSYNKQNRTTLVIVTHDSELASRCDLQVFLKDGQVEKITEKKVGKNA